MDELNHFDVTVAVLIKSLRRQLDIYPAKPAGVQKREKEKAEALLAEAEKAYELYRIRFGMMKRSLVDEMKSAGHTTIVKILEETTS